MAIDLLSCIDGICIEEQVAHAARCCQNLETASAELCEILFGHHPAKSLLVFDHLGLLLPPYSEEELESALDRRELTTLDRFESTVVATYLRAQYRLPELRVWVIKACPRGLPRQVLEFFLPGPEMTPVSCDLAKPEVLHIAFRPWATVEWYRLETAFLECGFVPGRSGVNPHERRVGDTRSPAGVALQYFRKTAFALGPVQIELVVPQPSIDNASAPGHLGCVV